MELALRNRYEEGAEYGDFPYDKERNLFDQAFGEQLDGNKRPLVGDFPPELQPHVSVEFLQEIRSRQPQCEALQKVINRVLDPSAYELRYDHLPDDEPGMPKIPGCAILHCRPP